MITCITLFALCWTGVGAIVSVPIITTTILASIGGKITGYVLGSIGLLGLIYYGVKGLIWLKETIAQYCQKQQNEYYDKTSEESSSGSGNIIILPQNQTKKSQDFEKKDSNDSTSSHNSTIQPIKTEKLKGKELLQKESIKLTKCFNQLKKTHDTIQEIVNSKIEIQKNKSQSSKSIEPKKEKINKIRPEIQTMLKLRQNIAYSVLEIDSELNNNEIQDNHIEIQSINENIEAANQRMKESHKAHENLFRDSFETPVDDVYELGMPIEIIKLN